MERKKTTLYVVMLAMMMALCCVLTVFVQIPMGNGYVNFGDAVIFLAASLLGPVAGAIVGGIGSCRYFQRIRGLRRVHARGKSRRRLRVWLGVQTPFSHSKMCRSPYSFDGSRFAVRYRGLLFHRLYSVRNSGGLSQPSQFAYSGRRKYGDSVRRSSAPSRTVRRRTER